MSRFLAPGSNSSSRDFDGGGGSASGTSNKSPSGKMPAARVTANCPSASSSPLIASSRNPHGQNFTACRGKMSASSMKPSCPWRCWGVRNVPLVQRTGFSCLIEIVALPIFTGTALACASQAIFNTAAHNSNPQARKQRANLVSKSRTVLETVLELKLALTRMRWGTIGRLFVRAVARPQTVHKLQPFLRFGTQTPRQALGENCETKTSAGAAENQLNFFVHFLGDGVLAFQGFEQLEHVWRGSDEAGTGVGIPFRFHGSHRLPAALRHARPLLRIDAPHARSQFGPQNVSSDGVFLYCRMPLDRSRLVMVVRGSRRGSPPNCHESPKTL